MRTPEIRASHASKRDGSQPGRRSGPDTTYNAEVYEQEARNGMFEAGLREHPISVASRDPEHDLCHIMVRAGLPDGAIRFWRGTVPSLRFRSVHRAAGCRIGLGEEFPSRRKRQSSSDLVGLSVGPDAGGNFEPGGYLITTQSGDGGPPDEGRHLLSAPDA